MYGADRDSGASGEALRYATGSYLFPRLLLQRGVSEKGRHFITENGGIGEKLMPLLLVFVMKIFKRKICLKFEKIYIMANYKYDNKSEFGMRMVNILIIKETEVDTVSKKDYNGLKKIE